MVYDSLNPPRSALKTSPLPSARGLFRASCKRPACEPEQTPCSRRRAWLRTDSARSATTATYVGHFAGRRRARAQNVSKGGPGAACRNQCAR